MNTKIPETPVPSSEKLVDAIRDHTSTIETQLAEKQAEIASLHRQIDAAMNEAGLLREQLAEKTKSFDAVQAYATALDTKLQVIIDVVGGVKAEAMRYGARKFTGVAPADTDGGTIKGVGDGRSLQDILASLPRPELSTTSG